ncbi:MAG: DUF2334 domain-containing protein [Candidatus Micrarchaeia archaeon]
MLERFWSFIEDHRNPLYIYRLMDDISLVKQLNEYELKNSRFDLIISVDVEQDFGSASNKPKNNYTKKFFKEVFPLLQFNQELFIQANILPEISSDLPKKIGLHGYTHDNWKLEWFSRGHQLSRLEKVDAITKSVDLFLEYGFDRPISFRAPNLAIYNSDYEILADFGFKFDSSFPSFRKPGIRMEKNFGVKIIPVSSTPYCYFSIPSRKHIIVNLGFLSKLGIDEFTTHCTNILKYQEIIGEKKYLLFFYHPWEFFKNKTFSYCSKENVSRLLNFIDSLKDQLNVRISTFQQSFD